MIKYWPNKPSADLNSAVANLFVQTYQKFYFKLSNHSNYYLPIDILSSHTKRQLFLEALIELEILVLDIIELNLSTQQINKLYNQILYDLIYKIMQKCIHKLHIKTTFHEISFCHKYNKLFFYEQPKIIQQLLTYLVFGSSCIENNFFAFYHNKTPIYHVKILFENFIIQVSNIVSFNLLDNCQSIEQISNLLSRQYLWSSKYQSIRGMSNFRNNVISHSWINFYIYYPHNIYCNQYQIWLFSSKGINFKYIYINRIHEYIKLSNLQLGTVIYLEIQDFVIPRINIFITAIGNLITYVLNEILSKSFKIFFNRIISKFSINNKNN